MKDKLIICILIGFLLILSLSGCERAREDGNLTDDKKVDVPVIRIGISSNFQGKAEDFEKINEEIGKLSTERIGCKIQIVMGGGYFNNEYQYFKSDEALDIQGFYKTQFKEYMKQHFILPLDEYLDKTTEPLLQAVGKTKDQLRMSDGRIYGIPKVLKDINSNGVMVSTKFLKKYHISPDSIHSMDDLEPVLEIIKKNEPDLIPYAINAPSSALIARDPIGDLLDGYLSIINYEDNSMTVKNRYETKEYKERVIMARRWKEKGYLQKDILTYVENGETLVYAGKAFATEFVVRPDEVQYAQNLYGDSVMIIPFDTKPVMNTGSDWTWVWCVSSQCDYPKEAIKALTMLYTDKDLVNLILYGRKNVNYVENADGSIRYPDGVDARTTTYLNNGKWMFNREIAKLWEGVSLDINEEMDKYNKTAVVSPAYGFWFDESQVTFDLAPLQEIIRQYDFKLQYGLMDPETGLVEFREKLKVAGSEELVKEVQRQLNVWYRNK